MLVPFAPHPSHSLALAPTSLSCALPWAVTPDLPPSQSPSHPPQASCASSPSPAPVWQRQHGLRAISTQAAFRGQPQAPKIPQWWPNPLICPGKVPPAAQGAQPAPSPPFPMTILGSPGNRGTPSPHLLEVGELHQLQSCLSILQIHSLVHPGLGVGRGEADQGLQGPGCDGGGLGGHRERGLCVTLTQEVSHPRWKTPIWREGSLCLSFPPPGPRGSCSQGSPWPHPSSSGSGCAGGNTPRRCSSLTPRSARA